MAATASRASAATSSSPRRSAIRANSAPYNANWAAMNTDSATPPLWFCVVWNDSPGSVEKQLRFRQSFQSARPISGRPWGPRLARVNPNERTRCSQSGTSVPSVLSKGTGWSRIVRSPVSLR